MVCGCLSFEHAWSKCVFVLWLMNVISGQIRFYVMIDAVLSRFCYELSVNVVC